MLAHDAVAAAVSHKHHLVIRVGAVLIQFVYGSHSCLAADLTVRKIHSLYSSFIDEEFIDEDQMTLQELMSLKRMPHTTLDGNHLNRQV